jgi:hypothetical protein
VFFLPPPQPPPPHTHLPSPLAPRRQAAPPEAAAEAGAKKQAASNAAQRAASNATSFRMFAFSKHVLGLASAAASRRLPAALRMAASAMGSTIKFTGVEASYKAALGAKDGSSGRYETALGSVYHARRDNEAVMDAMESADKELEEAKEAAVQAHPCYAVFGRVFGPDPLTAPSANLPRLVQLVLDGDTWGRSAEVGEVPPVDAR